MKHFKIIILLGKPGSGKGTQADILAGKIGFKHISTGDILRDRIKRNDALAAKIKRLIDRGNFVSDDIILDVAFEAIQNSLKEKMVGVVLDGLPRNLSQAESLEGFLKGENFEEPQVINIAISDDEAVFRIVHRKTCPECKRTIPYTKETIKLKKCPFCKTKLIARKDDSEEVVRKRLKIYEKDTAPLVDYYKNKGILKEIDGERPIEEIHRDILILVS